MPIRNFMVRKLHRLKIIGFFILLAAGTSGSATALDQQNTQDKTSLWSVQSVGGKVYLLGSVHFLRQTDYPLPNAMEQAYANCDRVVFETNIGAMGSPEIQQQMFGLGFYPENDNIFNHLSRDTADMLKDKLAGMGLPESLVSRLKPWTAAMTLEVLILKLMGFDEQAGIDFHFYQRAVTDGKHLEYFETIEYQLKLLAGLDDRNQDALLRQTLTEMERVEELAPKMVSYWRSGNFKKLTGLSPMPPYLHERLLTRRNQNWIERIQDYLVEPLNTLVVVGALHLAGPDSVVALLRQNGYTVVQH